MTYRDPADELVRTLEAERIKIVRPRLQPITETQAAIHRRILAAAVHEDDEEGAA